MKNIGREAAKKKKKKKRKKWAKNTKKKWIPRFRIAHFLKNKCISHSVFAKYMWDKPFFFFFFFALKQMC